MKTVEFQDCTIFLVETQEQEDFLAKLEQVLDEIFYPKPEIKELKNAKFFWKIHHDFPKDEFDCAYAIKGGEWSDFYKPLLNVNIHIEVPIIISRELGI
jgi:hypothetical protein